MSTGNLKRVEAITQFVGGTAAEWNNVLVPVPDRVLVIAIDTGEVKMGDGVRLYVNLPVLFNIQQIITMRTELTAVQAVIGTDPSVNLPDIQAALDQLVAQVENLADADHTHPLNRIQEFQQLNVTIDDFMFLNRVSVATAGQAHVLRSLGTLTGSVFAPTLADGNYQRGTLGVSAVTLNRPILPMNATAGTLTLYLTNNQPSTVVTLGTDMQYAGGDGLIILQGQTYKYKIEIHDTTASVTTTLMPS